MKTLELNQMEVVYGGAKGHADPVINAIGWGCLAASAVGIGASIFSWGFATPMAMGIVGGICLGAEIGNHVNIPKHRR